MMPSPAGRRPVASAAPSSMSRHTNPGAFSAAALTGSSSSTNGVMRRRREWFERHVEAHLVLWWVPAGHRPTAGEALERLAELREHGPGPRAFTFASPCTAAEADRHAGTAGHLQDGRRLRTAEHLQAVQPLQAARNLQPAQAPHEPAAAGGRPAAAGGAAPV